MKMLYEIPWLTTFYATPGGPLLTKSGLVKGDKIGAYDTANNLHFFEKDTQVHLNHEVWNYCENHGYWDMRDWGLTCPDCKTVQAIFKGDGHCYTPNIINV